MTVTQPHAMNVNPCSSAFPSPGATHGGLQDNVGMLPGLLGRSPQQKAGKVTPNQLSAFPP